MERCHGRRNGVYMQNKTWILIDLHKGKSPIIARWVFKTKIGNT
jgi:hypothetical protein